MQSKYFICCERCVEHIGKSSTKAARVWMDLCTLYHHFGYIILFDDMHLPAEIRSLEMLGFVISTETEKNIAVKMKGYIQTQEGDQMFCGLEGCHE